MPSEIEITAQQQEGVRRLAENIATVAKHWGRESVACALDLAELYDFARGPKTSLSLMAHSRALRETRDTLNVASRILTNAAQAQGPLDQQRPAIDHALRLICSSLQVVRAPLTSEP